MGQKLEQENLTGQILIKYSRLLNGPLNPHPDSHPTIFLLIVPLHNTHFPTKYKHVLKLLFATCKDWEWACFILLKRFMCKKLSSSIKYNFDVVFFFLICTILTLLNSLDLQTLNLAVDSNISNIRKIFIWNLEFFELNFCCVF